MKHIQITFKTERSTVDDKTSRALFHIANVHNKIKLGGKAMYKLQR